jgi:hypothetical protein
MATPRRSDAEPTTEAIVIPLSMVIDGPRPGRADPAADAVWRELRHQFFEWEHCHARFDPRRGVALPQKQHRIWREARREWLAKAFADDPRVDVSQ